ncbi:MAG: hypothetical protein AAF985_08145 [Bacteroidota bacterium]
MKTIRILYLFSLVCLLQSGLAQDDQKAEFSSIRIPSYELSFDSTLYMAFQRIIEANHPFSYVTLITRVNPIGNTRTIPLTDGEGAGGFIAEPYIDLNFPGLRGRPGNAHVLQSSHLLIKYGFHTRVARDASSPILPPTNRFGFEFNKVLWDNTSEIAAFSFRRHDKRNWFHEVSQSLKLLYLVSELQHYSNGQSSGVLKDSIQPVNDYRDGDFSTNFLKVNLIYSHLKRHNCALLSAGIGYRHDFGTEEGFLKFIPEQNQNYGKHRMLALFQWRSAPFEIFKFSSHKIPFFLRWLTPGRFVQRSLNEDTEFLVKSLYILTVRWEADYILGNLDRFRLDNKYRFGNHLFVELSSMRSRSIGFLFHTYYGRDYLNIRYDDLIFTWQLGITASLNKYTPIGFKSGDAIVRPFN